MRTPLISRVPVIQMSASPQPRFRKRAPTSNLRLDASSAQFPLFLPHLRVLLGFIYISLYLSSSSGPLSESGQEVDKDRTLHAFFLPKARSLVVPVFLFPCSLGPLFPVFPENQP